MIRIFFLALALAAAGTASANGKVFEIVEHAAEVMELELTADTRQLIYARRCDECPTVALSLDPQTRVFDGRRLISLGMATAFQKRGGTIFFDPATRKITRIVYWPVSRSDS